VAHLVRAFPILELLQDSHDPPLTPATVEELEIELGVRFPKDYVEFLLHFNGGDFHHRPIVFHVPRPTKWVQDGLMQSFLGDPADRFKYDGLVWSAQMLSDRFPEGYLAIANCHGNYVLLKFEGPRSEFAGVWFRDDGGFWIPEAGDNIHWLADTFNGFLEILLLDVDDFEQECETIPVFQAIERGNLRALEQFLTQGCDVEVRNAGGQTLLAAAAMYSWPKIVRLLLERSADPNARDAQGRTPLHHAATASIDSVKLLLAAGSDAKARDQDGKSVLAEWSYRADGILRAHGAVD
jgi:hypothetical protein